MIPTPSETEHRNQVMDRVLDAVKSSTVIRVPRLTPLADSTADKALVTLWSDDFGGQFGDYRYLFEGEDDLLHLMITRKDLRPLTPVEAQNVVAFVLPDVPPGLIWMKPGDVSQHFYLGHDILLED